MPAEPIVRISPFALTDYSIAVRRVSESTAFSNDRAQGRFPGEPEDSTAAKVQDLSSPTREYECRSTGTGTFLLWSVGHGRYLMVGSPGPPRYAAEVTAAAPSGAEASRFRFQPLA